jgi:hypothetical protein
MKYLFVADNIEIEFLTKEEAISFAATTEHKGVVLAESEKAERLLAKKKREYGLYISNEMIELLGARNKILGLTGTQVTSMLSQLAPVRALLETGALGTARGYITQFKVAFLNHADIFQDGIDDINKFEAEWGL